MSDLGSSPAPRDGGSSEAASSGGAPAGGGSSGGESSSDVPTWLLSAVFALILAMGAVFVVVLTHSDSSASDSSRDGAAPAPSYPSEWDSRVGPYASIAERLRGLDFKHPVAVRFLGPAAFEKTVTSDEKDLNGEDRTEIEQFTGLMRAFGLISGHVDLLAAVNDFSAGGILAYYSFDDKRITIRGHQLTPAVRSTLVHELTHALQDQYFDVGARAKELQKESDNGTTTSEGSVLDAIVEGDAERVQTLYRDSLTAPQRAALDAAQDDENAQGSERIKQVPPIIVTLLGSPYTFGQALVQTVAADGGNGGVNGLFRDTPTHESSLLDPFQVLAGDTGAIKVDIPQVRQGEKEFDSGEFGVVTWYLMLAERLPLPDALAAADGWDGDAYVAFERKGTSCARMTYQGRTPADTTRMFSALRRWVVAVPNSPAKVSHDSAGVHFESCDPGEMAPAGQGRSQDAVALATTRTYLGVTLLRAGATEGVARCMAGRLVGAFPLSQLTDPTFGATDPTVQSRIQQVTAPCR